MYPWRFALGRLFYTPGMARLAKQGVVLTKAADDGAAGGLVEAVVSVFSNEDDGGEIVMPGAFLKSLQVKLPKIAATGHNWSAALGHTVEARELYPGDPKLPEAISGLGGLWVKGQFNLDIQAARDALSNLMKGDLDEFSIGYSIVKSRRVYAQDRDEQDYWAPSKLYLDELKLYEWCPVIAGMNPLTELISAKGRFPYGGAYGIDDLVTEAAEAQERVRQALGSHRKEGRILSAANVSRLDGYATSLDEIAGAIRQLVADSTPKTDEDGKAKAKTVPDSVAMEAMRLRRELFALTYAE